MMERTKVIIEIDNLTEPQRLAIEDLLANWQALGCVGSSRWTAFYADGDGDFRPKITIDGRKPELCKLTDPLRRWQRLWRDVPQSHSLELYMIDFDEIAGALRTVANEARLKGSG